MNHSTKTLFKVLTLIAFVSFGFSSNAQTIYTTKQNVSYKKDKKADNNALADAATPVSFTETKQADFTLFTYPLRGTSFLAVKSAIPDQTVKVVVYDVTGKIIYNEMVPTGKDGKFEVQINPTMDFTPGDGFIAALYGNQVFYETLPLDK